MLDDRDARLRASLATVNVAKARCFYDVDEQILLAAIEASFGTVSAFNKHVRAILINVDLVGAPESGGADA